MHDFLLQRNRENENEKAKEGDYDVVMRQLQFDLKAKVTLCSFTGIICILNSETILDIMICKIMYC
jgi:hypothetical protein